MNDMAAECASRSALFPRLDTVLDARVSKILAAICSNMPCPIHQYLLNWFGVSTGSR